jgi:hypothetical protein
VPDLAMTWLITDPDHRGAVSPPVPARVEDSQNEVSIMKNKIAVHTAIASAVIAPAMVFAAGTAPRYQR